MKRKTATKTRNKYRRIEEALEHGEAIHDRSPWVISAGKCFVGRPMLDSSQRLIRDSQGVLKLEWTEVSIEFAKSNWNPIGWSFRKKGK